MAEIEEDNTIFIKKPLGLICGAGGFPAAVARAASRLGREVLCLKVTSEDTPGLERYKHKEFRLGEIGGILAELRAHNIQEVCLIGAVERPALTELRPDWGAMKHIPNLLALFQGGDNHLLSGVVRFLEDQGFQVLGAHQIAPDLMAGEGTFSKIQPNELALADIALGQEILNTLSPYDVGQSIVLREKRVMAIEGPEGTDAMLKRLPNLTKNDSNLLSGVLVKLPKTHQEQRIDMPVIGLSTLKLAFEAKLAGVAVLANQVLVLEQDEIMEFCQKHKMFVVGIKNQE